MRMEYTVVDPSNGQATVKYFDKAIGPDHVLDTEASKNLTKFTTPLVEDHRAAQKQIQEALEPKKSDA